MARVERPSAIILDLMMPNMDGFEVAAELHKDDQPTAKVPILVLTAKDLTVEDIRRLNGKIEEIFPKGSLNVDTLVARLTSVLSNLGVSRANRGAARGITPGRIRTCDRRFRKPLLYPLSYGRVEPSFRSLMGRRDRQCARQDSNLRPAV